MSALLRSPFATTANIRSSASLLPLSRAAALSTLSAARSDNGNTTTDPADARELSLGDFLTARTPEVRPDTPPMGGNYPPTRREINRRATPFTLQFKERIPLRYRVHCRSSHNNTMVQVTEPDGRTVAWFSGGSLKFKGVNRSTYEAGYQCAVKAIQAIQDVIKDKGPVQLELYLRGFGQGREAMKTALLAAEGEKIRHLFTSIQDRSPIKIGGTRAPKARRV